MTTNNHRWSVTIIMVRKEKFYKNLNYVKFCWLFDFLQIFQWYSLYNQNSKWKTTNICNCIYSLYEFGDSDLGSYIKWCIFSMVGSPIPIVSLLTTTAETIVSTTHICKNIKVEKFWLKLGIHSIKQRKQYLSKNDKAKSQNVQPHIIIL